MFGLHPNAEIGYLTNLGESLCFTILQCSGSSGGGSLLDDAGVLQFWCATHAAQQIKKTGNVQEFSEHSVQATRRWQASPRPPRAPRRARSRARDRKAGARPPALPALAWQDRWRTAQSRFGLRGVG